MRKLPVLVLLLMLAAAAVVSPERLSWGAEIRPDAPPLPGRTIYLTPIGPAFDPPGHRTTPSQPLPPFRDEFRWVYPLPWNWVHWWEANRDPYLTAPAQGGSVQKPDTQAATDQRDRAGQALLGALDSSNPDLRAAGALGLGRIVYAEAFTRLGVVAQSDPEVRVRLAALVAIGLLDTPEGEDFLVQLNVKKRPLDLEAGLVALGLRSELKDKTLEDLRGMVQTTEQRAVGVAAWVLAQHPQGENAWALRDRLEHTTRPWLASQALLSMGPQDPEKYAAPVAKILLDNADAVEVPVIAQLKSGDAMITGLWRGRDSRQAAYQNAYNQWERDIKEWSKTASYTVPEPPKEIQASVAPGWFHLGNDQLDWAYGYTEYRQLNQPVRFLYIGLERIDWANVRAAAAIALGQMNKGLAGEALKRTAQADGDRFSQPYQEMAIMALGERGEQPGVLAEILNPTPQGPGGVPRDKLDSPLRGFAAIALGLYCRPAKDQNSTERVGYTEICKLLGRRLADRQESEEVRAACALGLGLSQRTENLKYLQAGSEGIAPEQDVLAGYVILARGLLKDKNILEPAKKYLALQRDQVDLSGVVGTRAAVLGLGLLGAQEAIPILSSTWGRNYYVSQEAALAMALCQDAGASEPLLKMVKDGSNPKAQTFAARCLTELFVKSRPERLANLSNGANYMIKNRVLLPYQALANEFLYTCLIPAFGEQWENQQEVWEHDQREMLRNGVMLTAAPGPPVARVRRVTMFRLTIPN